jgi:lipoprotein-anchoring transpeptidase ErfK/SrfK
MVAAMPRGRSGWTCALLGLIVAGLVIGLTADTGAVAAVEARGSIRPQQLVTLFATHKVFAEPASTSEQIATVADHRPLTGERTVLPVLGAQSDPSGNRWFNVMLPGRPNGRTGWINGRSTVTGSTELSIVVDLATRIVTVLDGGHELRTAAAVVGKSTTPTPTGHFFVEEVVRLASTAVGAPYAFALSARSNVLQEFAGGPGQIALHGLGNIGGTLGTAASHGCIRLSTSMLSWMVTRIGPGVPVTIVE